MRNIKKLGVFVTIAVAGIVLAGCNKSSTPKQDLTGFAQCLTQQGVKMYGTNRCPHCQNQKKLFGDAFQYINFINCDPNNNGQLAIACQTANIKGYPTWAINGEKYAGEQTLERLSELTSCSIDATPSNGDNNQPEVNIEATGDVELPSTGDVSSTGDENSTGDTTTDVSTGS